MRRLFEKEYPSIVRFLYRHLGDQDQAEDLAQEAFVRLLTERPRKPRAWLFTVALNLARDAARGETRRSRHLQLLAAGHGEGLTPSPEEELVGRERKAAVRRTLGRLSERDRTLLLLWEEKVPYRQIAAELQVAPSSVGPLLARAQRRFLKNFDHPRETDHAKTSA